MAELIVAKHRSGAVGDVKLRFVNRYARFENWDENANIVNEAFGASGSGMEIRREDSRMNSESGAAGGFHFASAPDTHPDIMPGPGEDPVPF